jgi:hypothetical protein
MKKRILATILCLCIVIGAIGVPIAQAKWTNTQTITLGMSLNNGTITSEGTVVGKSGTTNISVTYTLEKLVNNNYTYVDSWPASSTSIYLGKSNNTYNCTGGTYKLTVIGTVTKGGVVEDIENWFTKTL